MKVRCPACLSAVEFADDPSPGDISCPSCGASLDMMAETTVTYTFREKETIGHFELLRPLGCGAFGEVWLARDTQLDRQVAIKIPRFDSLNPHEQLRLLREAQAGARLDHPNVVGVHDVGYEGSVVYIVSQYVEGMTLRDWLQGRTLTPDEAAQLCAKIAAGLHHLHEHGIVHRDIKPGNIMMDAHDEPRILDFGLAKREGDDTTIAVAGHVIGTPAYMSPEQAQGNAGDADRRTDVYSLGVILYEMLTGRTPFLKSDSALLHRIVAELPVSPRRLEPRVPRDLETICLKCLEKAPVRRYQSAEEVRADLNRYLAGETIKARRAGVPERVASWTRRHPFHAAAGTFFLMTVVLLGAVVSQSLRDDRTAMPNVPTVPTRKVRLITEPAGARLALVPVDEKTGELRPDEVIRPKGSTPLMLELPAGDYFIEAEIAGHGFHQVYRRVPQKDQVVIAGYYHTNCGVEGETIIPHPIKIPKTDDVIKDMVLVRGGTFLMGSEQWGGIIAFPHRRVVQDFYLDRTEFTLGQARELNLLPEEMAKRALTPEELAKPLTRISWDGALLRAEMLGKRLPREAEYEFVATNRGQNLYPWGDKPLWREQKELWPFGPVRTPGFDRCKDPELRDIFGLYSNVAEWTDSPMVFYPGAADFVAASGAKLAVPAMWGPARIIRGGPESVDTGTPDDAECGNGPRWRHSRSRDQRHPGLGFRCCRSRKPIYLSDAP